MCTAAGSVCLRYDCLAPDGHQVEDRYQTESRVVLLAGTASRPTKLALIPKRLKISGVLATVAP